MEADEYKLLSERRNIDASTIDDALSVVKQFIIENQLIIYGGQAIDYAMKLKGEYLYHDDIRPDFDFFSPDNVNMAYKLSKILYDKNFPNISCIYAMHVQTMRVRINFINIADISYIDKDIFDKIPTLVYDKMRFAHPHFQRIDMHFAFVYPFNPLMDDITHRWEKDIKRFNTLDRLYPIEPAMKDKIISHTIKTSIPEDINVIYTGFVAYHYLVPEDNDIKVVFKGNNIELTCPDFHETVDILSEYCEEYAEKNNLSWYEPWRDVIPDSVFSKDKKIHILSLAFQQFAINKTENDIILSGVQFTLMWFLQKAIFVDENYMRYYINILKKMDKFIDDVNDNNKFLLSIYAPSVVTAGKYNISYAMILSLARILEKVSSIPEDLIVDKGAVELLKSMPKNLYLNASNVGSIPVYNYDSIIYKCGGKIIE